MLFSVNFLLIYRAAEHMTSGLLAVMFSLTSLFNAFNGWLWLRQKPTPRIYPAAAMGVLGVALLFWQDMVHGDATLGSVLFALAGTFWFSCGNLVTVKVRERRACRCWPETAGPCSTACWCWAAGA